MPTQIEKAEKFLALHHGASPLLMPNAWDIGSAKLLASLGFAALVQSLLALRLVPLGVRLLSRDARTLSEPLKKWVRQNGCKPQSPRNRP